MIVFVPAYDPATEANMAVAARIVTVDDCALLGDSATRTELLGVLATSPEALLAMGHGRPDKLLAQGGETAVDDADLALLSGRPVFAFACHTAVRLGRQAAAAGTVWWGYTGSISAPETSEEILPLFVEIFAFLRATFPATDSTTSRKDVLLRIAEICQHAQHEVDDLLTAGAELDVVSVFLSLLQIWQRLRVWEPGAPEPMRHPEAPPPALFE